MQSLILTNNNSYARPLMAVTSRVIFPCVRAAGVFVGIKIMAWTKDSMLTVDCLFLT